MLFNKNTNNGFTIVELLIVVVVIAVLAVITIASFNGISARANDTAVQNDLLNMAKKLGMYYVDKGAYPDTNNPSEVASALEGFKASRGSYFTTGTNINLVYCTNAPDRNQFAIIAWSKTTTAKGYYITESSGVRDFNFAMTGGNATCTSAGIPATRAWMWMYDVLTSGGWRSFI
jgi:prepilin-type N-terminal cleavage/methylation domain-containing protein